MPPAWWRAGFIPRHGGFDSRPVASQQQQSFSGVPVLRRTERASHETKLLRGRGFMALSRFRASESWRNGFAVNEAEVEIDRMSFEPGIHVIARTYSAGVFAGILKSREGKEVVLTDARRIWYWDGAASLSELATKGTSKPNDCKFPAPVAEVLLTEVIEIIPTTDVARKSLNEVPAWTNH